MTITPQDLNHLKILAWLEEKPPVEKPQQIPVISPPSLNEKLLTLANHLKNAGFQKYADNLENKFFAYKKAENSLYDVTGETGENLVDQAHPDKDPEMAEASENLGVVENQVSKHEKILDVLNKKPTGKLASLFTYVNECKIVLAQQEGQGQGANFLSQFERWSKGFSKEISDSIIKAFNDPKYLNIELPNGKKVSDYIGSEEAYSNARTLIYIPRVLEGIVDALKEDPERKKELLGTTDTYVKVLLEFLQQLKLSQDRHTSGWDNYSAANSLFARFNSYIEEFQDIYSQAQGNKSENYHHQFFNLDELREDIDVSMKKFEPITSIITQYILSPDRVSEISKQDTGLIKWFEQELGYIGKTASSLNALSDKAVEYQNAGIESGYAADPNSPKKGLVNIDVLKELSGKISNDLLQDLKFDNKDQFISSLKNLSNSFLQDCINSLQQSKLTDSALKSQLLNVFQGLEQK